MPSTSPGRQNAPAWALVEDTRKVLCARGHPVATRPEVGSPARVICQVADKERFDLVVMGHGGKRRFVHILLRSVADRVAHTCSVPVVIFGAEDEQRACEKRPCTLQQLESGVSGSASRAGKGPLGRRP